MKQRSGMRSEKPGMEKRPQDTGNREQDTGHRTRDTGEGEFELQRGRDIARGLLDLGAQIVELLRRLPDDPAGRHLGIQLFRCATSPGANYAEARAAESKADFVHKISIAAKEMRESCFWIALLNRSGWVKQDLGPLVQQAERLAAILGASARTARGRGPGRR